MGGGSIIGTVRSILEPPLGHKRNFFSKEMSRVAFENVLFLNEFFLVFFFHNSFETKKNFLENSKNH